MVEVLCKQISHKYVGESHAIRMMSTTAVIVFMNLQIGSLLCLIQTTLKNSDNCGLLREQQNTVQQVIRVKKTRGAAAPRT